MVILRLKAMHCHYSTFYSLLILWKLDQFAIYNDYSVASEASRQVYYLSKWSDILTCRYMTLMVLQVADGILREAHSPHDQGAISRSGQHSGNNWLSCWILNKWWPKYFPVWVRITRTISATSSSAYPLNYSNSFYIVVLVSLSRPSVGKCTGYPLMVRFFTFFFIVSIYFTRYRIVYVDNVNWLSIIYFVIPGIHLLPFLRIISREFINAFIIKPFSRKYTLSFNGVFKRGIDIIELSCPFVG